MVEKPPPSQPWYIDVLTQGYLVEGFVDATELHYALSRRSAIDRMVFNLTQAQVVSTGIVEKPARLGSRFTTTIEQSIVIIPRDSAMQTYSTEHYMTQHQLEVVGLAGPYSVTGKLHLGSQGLADFSFCLLTDAQITSGVRGSHWPGVSVPMALLNPFALQGCFPV